MDSQTSPQSSAAPSPAPASTPTHQAVLPNVPDTWPGAWGLYKYSRQAVRRNWGTILGLTVISALLAGALTLLLGQAGRVLGELLDIIPYIALITAYLASVHGQKVSFGAALKAGLDPMLFLKFLATSILIGIGLCFLFLLLIVPGAIVLPRIILAPYFLLDRKLGPLQAISASWEATKGHAGKIWGTIGAAVAMALLMLTIVGIPLSLYFLFMYSAASVLVYEFISRAQPAAVTPDGAAAQAQPQAPQPPVSPVQQ